jgi:hypothetical protein
MAGHSLHLYGWIVACEVAFWAVLAIALTVRYGVGRARASRMLLLLLPAIDVLLLACTALDIAAGTRATFAHGLAIAYLGFTVAFGPLAVRWADSQFARHFTGSRPPSAVVARGWPAVLADLKLWLRCVLAWAITLLLLGALVTVLGDDAATRPLLIWYRIAVGSVVFWFVLGPLWSLVLLNRRRADA